MILAAKYDDNELMLPTLQPVSGVKIGLEMIGWLPTALQK